MNVVNIAKTDDQQRELGLFLQQLIFAGLQMKGSAPDWWATCEKYHRNDWVKASDMGEGTSPMHIPFSQPRQDMLVAQIATVVTKQDPIMLCESPLDESSSKSKESLVQKYWKSAGFELAFRRACLIATNTNRVFYRQVYLPDAKRPFSGLLFDVIHPNNFVVFPCTLSGLGAARIMGHRFYLRNREIRNMQAQGVYFEGTTFSSDSPEEYDTSGQITQSGAVPSVTGPDVLDQRVECWDVLFRYQDGDSPSDFKRGEKWYRATIAFKLGKLLSCEEYPYSRPWYFDAHIKTELDEAYWSATSVGRDLSGLQDATDKMHAANYNGTMMTVSPPIFGPELPEKDFRYTWGDYVPLDSNAQPWSPMIRYDGNPVMNSIEEYARIGDQVARISANTMGSVQDRTTTATENSIIASGVAVGIEEYIANFSEPLADMAAFTCELLESHFDTVAPYAELYGVTPEMLAAPCLWEPNGQTPGNTPGAKLGAVEQILQAALQLGPISGADPYEIFKTLVTNSGLSGASGIQIPREQMQQPMVPGQPGQPGQLNGNPNPNPAVAPNASGGSVPSNPGGTPGPSLPPMLQTGP